MSVSNRHPLYTDRLEDWEQLRDGHLGQRRIKDKGFRYLRPTSGMVQDGAEKSVESDGWKQYDAYRSRAVYPTFIRDAVEAMLGVMHHKPPTIDLPEAMEPMRERATLRNESLEMLLRRINEEQLVIGRLGLLAEVPDGPGAQLPHIALYQGETIINWDEGQRQGIELQNTNLVILDESEFVRQPDFSWKLEDRFRVLALGDVLENEPQGSGVYRVAILQQDHKTPAEDDYQTPVIGGTTTEEIPFVFINTKDIVPEPDQPSLLGLSDCALAVYRMEADYRQALFMQGQDTLLLIGRDDPDATVRVGAGAKIDVPMGGDGKYIGPDSQGIPEVREALRADYVRAGDKASRLVEDTGNEAESGKALRIRVSARTATLNQIALAGAFGLQENLRQIARWIGANPEEVVVTPNTDFVDDVLEGRTLVEYVSAKTMGMPLAWETLHKIAQARGLTENTLEDELKLIEEEEQNELLRREEGSTNPDGPESDPENGGQGGGQEGGGSTEEE